MIKYNLKNVTYIIFLSSLKDRNIKNIAGGKSDIKSSVSPSSSKSLPKQEVGVICACGKSDGINKVRAEVRQNFLFSVFFF